MTDPAGTVTTEYTYEPFGNTTVTGASNANPFQYTGREADGTGLYYYRARYYHPTLQRFIAEDPIGFLGGLNAYAYVINNPLNRVDRRGLRPGDRYPTLDDAGREAVCDILDDSVTAGREFGSYVSQNPDGTFSYGPPAVGTPTSVRFPIPAGVRVRGWYHTHPLPTQIQTFSQPDIDTSQRLGPGFLGLNNRRVLKYNPLPGRKEELDPCGPRASGVE